MSDNWAVGVGSHSGVMPRMTYFWMYASFKLSFV